MKNKLIIVVSLICFLLVGIIVSWRIYVQLFKIDPFEPTTLEIWGTTLYVEKKLKVRNVGDSNTGHGSNVVYLTNGDDISFETLSGEGNDLRYNFFEYDDNYYFLVSSKETSNSGGRLIELFKLTSEEYIEEYDLWGAIISSIPCEHPEYKGNGMIEYIGDSNECDFFESREENAPIHIDGLKVLERKENINLK